MKNVFALFLDILTGNVFDDNAQEFIHGDFDDICKKHRIQQVPSPPYEPNKNPVELRMDILTGMMRSLLFISGLNPEKLWEDALIQSTHTQIRTALPGRCTPCELTYGRRPDVTNLRIFGCEVLAYVEKEKR